MIIKYIPNFLSIFRILVSPLVFYYIYIGDKFSLVIALFLFLLGSASDALDGYIARNYNVITDLGKNLDPIADKIFIQASFIAIYLTKEVPITLWMLFLIIFRDVFVTCVRYQSNKYNVAFETSRLAKNKTLYQVITIMAILLIMISYQDCYKPIQYANIFNYNIRMGDVIVYVITASCSIFTFYTGIDYFIKYKNAKNAK